MPFFQNFFNDHDMFIVSIRSNSFLQLSASGDSGIPEVVADPQGEVANTFQNLGVCVVQQCAKIRQQGNRSSNISFVDILQNQFYLLTFLSNYQRYYLKIL